MKVFLEIAPSAGLCNWDEFGNPAAVGAALTLEGIRDDVPYDEVVSCLDLDAIAQGLQIKREELTVLSPEEYEEKYGGEDDE